MVSKNIPPNGWPQLKDLEAVQPTLDRLDKIEAWKRTVKEETFTGEEITIPNALALPARSLKTTINAIQDLHGYDHPWVGGAGKNKLPYFSNATSGSIVMTVGDDGILSFSGTSGASPSIIGAFDLSLPAGTYTMSDDAPNASAVYLQIYNVTTSTLYWVDTTKTFTHNGTDSLKARIWVKGDSTSLNHKLKPMVEVGQTASSYAPYSNICPISGRTAVTITRSDGDEISEDFTIQLGTTVYGAEINWDTGVMTVDTALVTYDENSGFAKFDTIAARTRYVLYSPVSPLAKVTTNNFADIISNRCKGVIGDPVNLGEIALRASSTPQWLMLVSDKTTIEAFNADIAATPIQVEYPLATPITIQLTPEQLEMLKGYNHITLSDGYGTIELKALTGANWS